MAWPIECTNCGKVSNPANIVKLMEEHLDDQGWILCGHCKSSGYIEKKFKLQKGDPQGVWNPYLRGVIRPSLHDSNNTYQPFAFLVSYTPDEDPDDVWFCYYKDTRAQGGRLKMGHGPGGPPVFTAEAVLNLVAQMVKRGCLSADKALDVICTAARPLKQEGGENMTDAEAKAATYSKFAKWRVEWRKKNPGRESPTGDDAFTFYCEEVAGTPIEQIPRREWQEVHAWLRGWRLLSDD